MKKLLGWFRDAESIFRGIKTWAHQHKIRSCKRFVLTKDLYALQFNKRNLGWVCQWSLVLKPWSLVAPTWLEDRQITWNKNNISEVQSQVYSFTCRAGWRLWSAVQELPSTLLQQAGVLYCAKAYRSKHKIRQPALWCGHHSRFQTYQNGPCRQVTLNTAKIQGIDNEYRLARKERTPISW